MASSKRSTPRAKSSSTTSRATKQTSTSSPTTSTSSTTSVVIALGSNLGDRALHLRRALYELSRVVHLVRISSVHETKAVDSPAGSPDYLNLVVVGHTAMEPLDLLHTMQLIETRLGRVRTRVRNEPRVIDLDLIFYGAVRMRTRELTLPHPRWSERAFVTRPLGEVYRVPIAAPPSTPTRAVRT